MKNKHKVKQRLAGCLLGVLLFIICLIPVKAMDVGNSFSGGSSSGGGGGSSSTGGGFSGGGSYNNSSYGSSSSGSGGGAILIVFGFGAFIVVCGFIAVLGKTETNQTKSSDYTSNDDIHEEETIMNIQKLDPHFSAEHFKTFTSEVYLCLQEAWEKRDWQGVRPFESNNLFNVHNRQLQEYIDQQKTNHLDMQNIREMKLASFKVDGNYEVLSVKLDASLLDYVTDDKTGQILEGNKTTHQLRSYRLEFIRTACVQTASDKTLNVTNCPNCGAPTSVTSSGMCEFCKSVITTGEFGWVLNKYAKW